MNTKSRKRVSKSDWLAKALEVLANEGLAGVRVERLARDLKVAKSGFYWHFRDRKDLLKQMLEYWAYEYTTVVQHNKKLQCMNPRARLKTIMHMIQDFNLAKYDLAICAWGENDPLAKQAMEDVVKARLRVIKNAFEELGFKGDELEMRTRLFVCYHSWEAIMFRNDSQRKRNRLLNLRHKFLTGLCPL